MSESLNSDAAAAKPANAANAPYLGLRTAIYGAPDIAAARTWYADVLGTEPYFNEPYYVGFNVGGFELGLIPDATGKGQGSVAVYWGVDDAKATVADLLSRGATEKEMLHDVGEGILVASVVDPFGNIFGIIENPHFQLPDR